MTNVHICTSSLLCCCLWILAVSAGWGSCVDTTVRQHSGNGVVPHSSASPVGLLLLLQTDGSISARRLDTGLQMWTVSTGGSVLSVDVSKHASSEMAQSDPFALPFIIEGGMLFTRRAYLDEKGGRRLPTKFTADDAFDDAGEDDYNMDGAPFTPSHPQYFMNLSTLIRRRHVHVDNTEIYVTTSVRLMDFDSYSGAPVVETSSLTAFLHVVLCNVTIHVVRRDTYMWKMSVAQYKLSEEFSPQGPENSHGREEDQDFIASVVEEHGRRNDRRSLLAMQARLSDVVSSLGFKRNTLDVHGLVMREVGSHLYTLWNTFTDAAEWPTAIGMAHGVVNAFLWLPGRGGVIPMPLYRFLRSTSADTFAEGSETGVMQRNDLPSLLSDRSWTQRNMRLKPYVATWEDDVAADERETEELHRSFKQCSWLQECSARPRQIITYSVRDGMEGNESVPMVSLTYVLLNSITKRTLFFAFQTVCIIVSTTLVGFGMLLRPRLRNAWAQYDSLMDNMRHSSKSTPTGFVVVDRSGRFDSTAGGGVQVSVGESPLLMLSTVASPLVDAVTLPAQMEVMEVSASANEISTGLGDTWWRNPNDYDGDDDSCVGGESSVSLRGSVSATQTTQSLASPMPQLFQQHFDVLKKVGRGGEGNVFCVKHQVTGAMYAIKAVRIREEEKQRCVREAILHSSLDNPNVVRYFYSWIESIPRNIAEAHGIVNNDSIEGSMSFYADESFGTLTETVVSAADAPLNVLFIQMEYFKSGTLADYFRDRGSFTRLENVEHLLQIVRGLRYIHQQEVIHRDLKPTNIFVSDAGVMKIGDFGLAKRWQTTVGWKRTSMEDFASTTVLFDDERSFAGGTPLYWSPEQQCGGSATAASDVFSLGLIAVEFYCQFTTQHERLRTLGDARHGELPQALEDDFPEEANIFRQMLCEEPAGRPSVDDVVQRLKHVVGDIRSSGSGVGRPTANGHPCEVCDADAAAPASPPAGAPVLNQALTGSPGGVRADDVSSVESSTIQRFSCVA